MSPTKGKKYNRIKRNRKRDGGAIPLIAPAIGALLAPMSKVALAKSAAKIAAIMTAPLWAPALTYKAGKTIVKGTAKGTAAAAKGTYKLVRGKKKGGCIMSGMCVGPQYLENQPGTIQYKRKYGNTHRGRFDLRNFGF